MANSVEGLEDTFIHRSIRYGKLPHPAGLDFFYLSEDMHLYRKHRAGNTLRCAVSEWSFDVNGVKLVLPVCDGTPDNLCGHTIDRYSYQYLSLTRAVKLVLCHLNQRGLCDGITKQDFCDVVKSMQSVYRAGEEPWSDALVTAYYQAREAGIRFLRSHPGKAFAQAADIESEIKGEILRCGLFEAELLYLEARYILLSLAREEDILAVAVDEIYVDLFVEDEELGPVVVADEPVLPVAFGEGMEVDVVSGEIKDEVGGGCM